MSNIDATAAYFRDGDETALSSIVPPEPAPEPKPEPARQHGMRVITGGKVKHAEAERPPFVFTSIGEMLDTEPEFLIDGLIETNSIGTLFAKSGGFKSFLAMAFASCVATGVDFYGHEVKQGSVFYIAGEGQQGMKRRLTAWENENGQSLKEWPIYASSIAVNMLDPFHVSDMTSAVDTLSIEHGVPSLIILDTVARCFGAGDENSTRDMNTFVAAVTQLKSKYPDCVVLMVHHTGLAERERARGSSALKGANDFEYRMDTQGDTVTLTCTKMKEAQEPDALAFKVKDVPLGVDKKGKPYGSAVLVQTDVPARQAKPLTASLKLGLRTYRMAGEKYGVTDNGAFHGLHIDHWREYFYRGHTGDNTDTKRRAFSRVRAGLVQRGKMKKSGDDLFLLLGSGGADLLEHILARDAGT